MISPFIKPRALDGSQIKAASEFHGHSGPFLVLGLRMGQLALRLLDARGYFDLRCVVKVRWSPPQSCIIDGIQFSTGCTMGKRNIEIIEQGEGIAAVFSDGEKSLRIQVKSSVLRLISRALRIGTAERLIEDLLSAADDELFDYQMRCEEAPSKDLKS
ncbi:hypothetical protein DRO56_02065 [Candidatus Bathyarchaeota archaeon]|nr:MAG: hypothetical protein CW700_01260 [Candidatus Bathyarchaeota archaeon]RLI33287.1 MAG: hypothetical protein DRO56_02065 [Candidatus Bathyarchaeota archaeon]